MFSLTSTTGFALLAAVSLLPVSLSLPQPQIDDIPPELISFDVNASLPPPLDAYPDFPIPDTNFFFRFMESNDQFTRAEIDCLFEKADAIISTRPAGEVIPSSATWRRRTQGPFPYASKVDYISFGLSNEGNDPRYTKELGVTVMKAFREWLKNKPISVKLGGVLILEPGSRHSIGILGFSSQFHSEPVSMK